MPCSFCVAGEAPEKTKNLGQDNRIKSEKPGVVVAQGICLVILRTNGTKNLCFDFEYGENLLTTDEHRWTQIKIRRKGGKGKISAGPCPASVTPGGWVYWRDSRMVAASGS